MNNRPEEVRDLESIENPEKMQLLLKKYLTGKTMQLKESDPPLEGVLLQSDTQGNILMKIQNSPLKVGDSVVIFRTIGRYVQLECTVQRIKDGIHLLALNRASIAKKERQFLRLSSESDILYITNIRTSKYALDRPLGSLPTSIKVNFSMVEKKLKLKDDFARVDAFEENNPLHIALRQSGKILYVRDTNNPDDYEVKDRDYFNYREFLGNNFIKKINDYRTAGIRSEIIYPIAFGEEISQFPPVGYVQVQSKYRFYEESKIEFLIEIVHDMIDQIRKANTVLIQKKQKVLNISRGGLRVSITDNELKEYLTRMTGFTFDLFFKMQAPITLYGLIRSIQKKMNGEMILGIQISGHSSRAGEMSRFLDNVSTLEKRMLIKLAERKRT
jgi:hypothetical protein